MTSGGTSKWLIYLALSAVCVLAAAVLAAIVAIATLLVALSMGFFLLAIAAGLKQLPQKSADPYDLRELKRVHRLDEFRQVDDSPIDEDADVVCPHCGNLYDSQFPVCPECGRRG